MFNAILGFASFAASFRYELAIVTVDDEQRAHDVAVFVVLVSLACGAVSSAVVALLTVAFASEHSSADVFRALELLPLALVLAGVVQAANNLCVRERCYVRIALQQVSVALITVVLQAALVHVAWTGGGLVIAYVGAQLGGALVLGGRLFAILTDRLRQPGLLARMRRTAYDHRGHVYYTTPYSFVTQLYFQAPTLFLGMYYGVKEAGFFGLAYRTISAPISLVPMAMAQVFFPELARNRARLGAWEERLRNSFTALGLLMAPAVAVALAFGPDLYAYVFGDSWRPAGAVAQAVVLPLLMMALASGIDRLYFVLDEQRTALTVTGGAFLLSVALVLVATCFAAGAQSAITGWAVAHLIYTVVWMTVAYRIAGFSAKALGLRIGLILAASGVICVLLIGGRTLADGSALALSFMAAGLAGLYALIARRAVLMLTRALSWQDGPS